ncbi:MAG: mechanosensitive ion channel [Tissierellia bacterium]|nr:mechanosensitive ion channel [Tissierellia bacterium]
MNTFFELMKTYEEGEILINVLKTLAVVLVIFAINKVVSYGTKKWMNNQKAAGIINRSTTYILFVIGLISVSRTWFDRTRSTTVIFGLTIALIIFASKDLIKNISAWFYIMGRDMFEIGDRLQIGDLIGDVVDIGLLHTYMAEVKGDLLDKLDNTGRYVSVPNSYIFDQPFFNFRHDFVFVWTEVNLLIPFDADYTKALEVAGKMSYELYETLLDKYDKEELADFERISKTFKQDLKPAIRADIKPQGIAIYVTFFCRYNEIVSIKSYYHFNLWNELKHHNIPVIFPKAIVVEDTPFD